VSVALDFKRCGIFNMKYLKILKAAQLRTLKKELLKGSSLYKSK
jgi:hypothetical protein